MSDPFVIEAQLREPIVTYGDGLHLDGPLAYAVFADLLPERRAEIPPIESDWAEDFDLPLDRWEEPCELPETADARLTVDGELISIDGGGYRGVVWGWCCSAAIPIGPVLDSRHALRKRPDVAAMLRYTDARRFEMGGGPHKAKDLAFPTIHTRTLRWYAVGDEDRTLALLQRHVPAIGKLARQGMGRVAKWSLLAADGNYALRGEDDRPMRRLPAMAFLDRQAILGTFRAPYHHRSRWGVVVEAEAWKQEWPC